MNKKIFVSFLVLILLLIGTTGAVIAYFSDTKIISDNTFTTGSVRLDSSLTTPIIFENLLPGDSQSQDISIKYDGTVKADLYFGISNQNLINSPFYNSVEEESYLELSVFDNDSSETIIDWQDYKFFLINWSELMAQVDPGTTKNYRIDARLKSSVENDLQGKTDSSNLIFHTVQSGAGVQLDGDPMMSF
jgi:predicted ribosomally synthesized peptide with SipW-like signal peptide